MFRMKVCILMKFILYYLEMSPPPHLYHNYWAHKHCFTKPSKGHSSQMRILIDFNLTTIFQF